ncbi:YheC/YheD family protein [Hazenella coriacea]|uniref:YheC/D-like protein n=1 Tax=Hazenella coriacea TaxID=1179467 RepID=A0A4R3LBV1_9BACL|nr:YheC/YheD family protein [Hazenella coriacea]TCS96778.1 YheC/D-like protein [Hazenella coriacea]
MNTLFQSSTHSFPEMNIHLASNQVTHRHSQKSKRPARITQQNSTNGGSPRPRIGILTADGGNPFRGNHQNFIDIIRTGKRMGVPVFVITPQCISSDYKQVYGYFLSNSTKVKWVRKLTTLPPVIYNRVPNRVEERRPSMQETIENLKKIPHLHFYNPSFFDKWTLYQDLNTTKLHSYLPETSLLDQPQTFKQMLFRYPILYLKPIDGKAGIGMIQITQEPEEIKLIHQTAKRKEKKQFTTFTDLWPTIQQLCKQQPYLIQQGISLATYQGKPFDVRILLQKNRKGSWALTGIGIRVAGKSAISTHVPMGGRIENVQRVFQSVFGKRKNDMLKKVEEMGLQLAQSIDNKQSSPLGEMSMDLGVEPQGHCWFFEANAKPMKFDEPHIRSLSLRRIIEYACFLCGY